MAYKHKTVYGFFKAHPDRWIKRYLQKDIKGRGTCFCLLGKIDDIYDGREHVKATRRVNDVITKFLISRDRYAGLVAITGFNDARKRTVADIIAVAKESKI